MICLGGIVSRSARAVLASMALCSVVNLAQAEAPKPTETGAKAGLIPRKLLFGNPDRAAPRLSPDGKQLAFLAPVNGVLNVWVAPIDRPDDARPVSADKKRGIRIYFWAYTNDHVLYLQDSDGDEDYHVYCVDLPRGQTKDLTPYKKVRAMIVEVGHNFPHELLVGLNDRDPRYHDLYRVDLLTGERKLEQKNPGFQGFLTDDNYRVRLASKMTPDGGMLLLKPNGQDQWSDFLKIPMADTLTTSPAGFDKSGDVLYLIDSRGRDTGAFTTLDMKSGKETVVAQDKRNDAGQVLLHPTENTVQAVSFTYERTHWVFQDPAVKADFEELRKLGDGEVSIESRTLDDQQWLVSLAVDNGPVRYYRYERPTKKPTFLFTNRKDLEGLPLQKMHAQVVKARDGLDLVCYLTLPPGSDPDNKGRPSAQLPMVLDVHGGPWGRDTWGFDPQHQFLANRGYAVLSVNFRGSTGFGKEFVNAGNREWARKMHDDLLDAVAWAVREKIADPQKVAIFGGSYGGYATLVGMTFTPETFACGVDIVGPSNLVTLLSTIPPYWAPMVQLFKDRVGDFTSKEGKEFLLSRSPLTHAERISRPLLIAQGANDPRVKQAEADQIVQAMRAKKLPVTYVLFPDEGHGFARPENRLAFNAVTEAFLAQHLGGRYEAIGDAFAGSTITVPEGASDVPGLADKISAKAGEGSPKSGQK
ncbi:MAG TPA: S9 family peptidase [Gemmataceae bacterium]|nr:S9 family peptidase [Gemmataceae bacterium]